MLIIPYVSTPITCLFCLLTVSSSSVVKNSVLNSFAKHEICISYAVTSGDDEVD